MKKTIFITAIIVLTLMVSLARLNRMLLADGGIFYLTEHGGTDQNTNTVTGANRASVNPPYTTGECVICHEQHASVGGAEPAPVKPGPDDLLLFQTNNNDFCFTCHTGVIPPGGPSYTANNNSWAGKAVWDNLVTNLSGHGTTQATNYWPGTNPPARVAADAGKCVNCHNPHGRTFAFTGDDNAAPQRAMATTDPTLEMTTRVEENLCLGCHKPGGPANAADIQTMFTLGTNISPAYYNHPVSRDSAINDRTPSYHNIIESKNLYQTQVWGPPQQTERHVECVDCHNPHYAGYGGAAGSNVHTLPTNKASSVIYGTWGVRTAGDPSLPASWPSGQAKGSGTLQAAPGFTLNKIDETGTDYEWELCLRCHSSYSWMPTYVAPNKVTDISREINPNNIAHHALTSKGDNQAPTIGAQYDGNFTFASPRTATIHCTDCHTGRETAVLNDPEGPHGSDRKWLIGTFCEQRPAYGGPANCAVAEETVICFKCHNYNVYFKSAYLAGSYGSRFTHPTVGNHVDNAANAWGIWCMNCHAGAVEGAIHGTNAAIGASGADPLGRHFLNGAAITGFTENAGGGNFQCWTQGAADGIYNLTCKQHSGGKKVGYNFLAY